MRITPTVEALFISPRSQATIHALLVHLSPNDPRSQATIHALLVHLSPNDPRSQATIHAFSWKPHR